MSAFTKKIFLLLMAAILTSNMIVFPIHAVNNDPQPEKKKSGDSIVSTSGIQYVAKVNGVEISATDLDRKFSLIKERFAKMGTPLEDSKLQEYRQNILNNLIDQEVLYQDSIAQGIKIPADEVNAELEKFKKQFETEDAFKKQIQEMNFTEKDILSQIERSKTIQKYIEDKVKSEIRVSEKDQKKYYNDHIDQFKLPERIHASHILVKLDPKAKDAERKEALKKIEDIKAKLNKGEDFAKIAEEFSDCPSKSKGGDLGFFIRGQMVKPFEDAAFRLEPGQTSGIVETQFGFHIIKSQEKTKPTTLAFDDVKEKIQTKIKDEQFKESFPKYLETLKKKYTIEIPDGDPAISTPASAKEK